MLYKTDSTMPCFERTKSALQVHAEFFAQVEDKIVAFPRGAKVETPKAMTPGTDYVILATKAGLLVAVAPDAKEGAPVGGFHFAPGGNAARRSGGNTTPQINPFSIWDLKFRPGCPDPSGMTLVDGRFWADIYLTSVAGQSRLGAVIADGKNPPKSPTAYDNLNYYQASAVAHAAGKRLFTREEFLVAAFGVLEKSSANAREDETRLDAPRTSRWGLIQATGCRWIWGRADILQDAKGFNSDRDIGTNIFGASWVIGSSAGSRAASWASSPLSSASSIGLRCACDHVCLP